MIAFFEYLSYVLRHKWFVFQECTKYGLYWRGLKHDWTKLMPQAEFIPYMNFFHGPNAKAKRDKTGYYKPTDTGDDAFDLAWLHHQKWNDHHWQWWIVPQDDGGFKALEMSDEARKEMVADWKGAGRAQGKVGPNGEPEVLAWYKANCWKMTLGPETRTWVEQELGVTAGYVPSPAEVFKLPLAGEKQVRHFGAWIDQLKYAGQNIGLRAFYFQQQADRVFVLHKPSGHYLVTTKWLLLTHWRPIGMKIVNAVEEVA